MRSRLALRRPSGAVRWRPLAAAALAWAVMMVLVARHERLRAGAELRRLGLSPEALLVAWSDIAQWHRILSGGEPIGIAYLAILAEDAPAPAAPERLERRYSADSYLMLRRPAPVRARVVADLNAAFEAQTLRAQAELLGRVWQVDAFVESGSLYYRLATDEGGRTAQRVGRAPLAEPILMQDALVPLLIRSDRFQPGTQWTVRAAAPLGGGFDRTVHIETLGRETIDQAGRSVSAWKVRERAGRLESVAWYEDDGALVRRTLPGGLVLEPASPDEVRAIDPQWQRLPELPPLDRDAIRRSVEPDLDGRPLDQLLPSLPLG